MSRTVPLVRAAFNDLLVPWLRRAPDRAERAQAALEELGGTWVKLGQALALRFDLLPADYCLQFFQLLNQVRPFPPAAVRVALEQELGAAGRAALSLLRVGALRRRFDRAGPSRRASRRYRRRRQGPAARHPEVSARRPAADGLGSGSARRLCRSSAHTRARDSSPSSRAGREEELDYRRGAPRRGAARECAAAIPRAQPAGPAAYTTSRVLTLEYLERIPLIEVSRPSAVAIAAFLEELARPRTRPRGGSPAASSGMLSTRSIGSATSTPIRIPPTSSCSTDDAIGYVDFGIVGKLDRADDRARCATSRRASLPGALARAVDEFMRFLSPVRIRTDLAAARRDLLEAIENYLESARVGPGGLRPHRRRLRDRHAGASCACTRWRSTPDAVRYLKAVLTAEAMVRELDPQFDLRGHENRFFGRLMQIELAERLNLAHAAQWLTDARFRVDDCSARSRARWRRPRRSSPWGSASAGACRCSRRSRFSDGWPILVTMPAADRGRRVPRLATSSAGDLRRRASVSSPCRS